MAVSTLNDFFLILQATQLELALGQAANTSDVLAICQPFDPWVHDLDAFFRLTHSQIGIDGVKGICLLSRSRALTRKFLFFQTFLTWINII
jgi:hypothetical protein